MAQTALAGYEEWGGPSPWHSERLESYIPVGSIVWFISTPVAFVVVIRYSLHNYLNREVFGNSSIRVEICSISC